MSNPQVANGNIGPLTALYDPSTGKLGIAWQAGPVAQDPSTGIYYAPGAMDVTVEANEPVSSSAALTQVAGSAASVALLAANTSRKAAYIYNNSTVNLYLAYALTASASAFTIKIPPATLWEMPTSPIWQGALSGIWESATGNAQITEVS